MSMKKLRDVHRLKDIPRPSFYSSRSAHCPLHTARNTTRQIRDCVTLVIGVAECTYYICNGQDNLVTLPLDWQDVTFGCTRKLEAAFAELIDEYAPKAVFLMTTCVPEITGDDLDAAAEELSTRYHIPVTVVHTEHFKTEQASAGTAAVMDSCIHLMQPAPPQNCVNILGGNRDDFLSCELAAFLLASEVPIGTIIPDCSLDELRKASGSRLNIVISRAAEPLAKAMEQQFSIPYVLFLSHIYPDRILAAYQTLFNALALPVPAAVTAACEQTAAAAKQLRTTREETTCFTGRTPFPTFEFNAFLTEHGLNPLLMEAKEIPGSNDPDLQMILQHADPYVVIELNSDETDTLRNTLNPELQIGSRGRGGSSCPGFREAFDYITALTRGENGPQRQEHRRDRKHSDRGHHNRRAHQ